MIIDFEEIEILPELKNLIPPLSESEKKVLEESILKEGCHNPIILWLKEKDKYVLVDGHNRFEICQKHNIRFTYNTYKFKNFKDIEEAKQWMISHQQARRNINKLTRAYLIGAEYNLMKKSKALNFQGKEAFTDSTAEILAKKYKESESTIKRYSKTTMQIDEILKENPERELLSSIRNIKNEILAEDISFKEVQTLYENRHDLKLSGNSLRDIIKQANSFKNVSKEADKILNTPKVQNETLVGSYIPNAKSEIEETDLKELSKSYNDEYGELKAQLENLKLLNEQYLERAKKAEAENKEKITTDNLPNIRISKCAKLCEAGFKLFRANYLRKTIEKFDLASMSFQTYKTDFVSTSQLDKYIFNIDNEEWNHIVLLPKNK